MCVVGEMAAVRPCFPPSPSPPPAKHVICMYVCMYTYIHVHLLSETNSTYLDGVVQGQDVHALPVGHVGAGGERHEVAQAHPEVLADHLCGGVCVCFLMGVGVVV